MKTLLKHSPCPWLAWHSHSYPYTWSQMFPTRKGPGSTAPCQCILAPSPNHIPLLSEYMCSSKSIRAETKLPATSWKCPNCCSYFCFHVQNHTFEIGLQPTHPSHSLPGWKYYSCCQPESLWFFNLLVRSLAKSKLKIKHGEGITHMALDWTENNTQLQDSQ